MIACRFLLVSLSIDAILGEVTIGQRRKKLEEMKRGYNLSDAYTATLTRLKTQTRHKSILGMKVLMWVLYSERPVRAEELCHALGVEIGSSDLDHENVPMLQTLLKSCLGLVTVEASSSTVRLVHFTLKEYFSNGPMLFDNPHSTIAEVCLTYLNFRSVRDLSPIVRSAPSTMPLLEYASRYWGKHAKRGMTENAKPLALKLLDRFDEHISTQLLLLHYNQTRSSGLYFSSTGGPTGFTGLHGVAFLGIAEIVAAVLQMKEWEYNAVDCMGSTALTWATRGGQEETVKALLKQEDIDPNMADTQDGRTPLTRAVENGHEGLVKILLEREDTNPNTPDTKYGRTPLSWAVQCEHEEVVKVLLERGDINPNAADAQDGRTPLTRAVENGHEELVRILLEREDTNPNTADTEYGRTPLSWAAWHGNEGAVEMLLGRQDTNPNTADTKHGRTPLWWAVRRGHEKVVKVLLEREGINADQAGAQCGQTPLSLAAECGYEGVVRMLLGRKDVNPNTADTKYGRTPISWAAWRGREGVVKVLFERKDVRTATLDNKNQTPLSLALYQGHDAVARILLERDHIDSYTGDRSGQASFSPSAGDGGQCAAEMRFKDDNSNTNITSLIGQPAVNKPAVEKPAVEKSVAEWSKENLILNDEQVSERLKDVIINHRKGLQKMYGEIEVELDESLKGPIKRGEEMARRLITLGCNTEVAKGLTVLALYDVAILIGMF